MMKYVIDTSILLLSILIVLSRTVYPLRCVSSQRQQMLSLHLGNGPDWEREEKVMQRMVIR